MRNLRTRDVIAIGAAASLIVLAGCTSAAAPAVSTAAASPGGARWVGDSVRVDLPRGHADIDPATLAVHWTGDAGQKADWSDPAFAAAKVSRGSAAGGKAAWTVDGYRVSARSVDGRLALSLESTADRSLEWPRTAVDPSTKSIEFPNGSGQSVPVTDAFWASAKSGLPDSEWQLAGDLTMPFWGTTGKGHGVDYIVPTDIDTSLGFAVEGGRIRASATHAFDAGDGTSRYEVLFAANDGGPVASALDYRDYLEKTSGITTLDEKIRQNPEAAKLVGALHAYGWGDGRSAEIVERLAKLGVDRLWLGYDADGSPMSADAVAAAKKAGYLVAPYDTWENAQDPASADTESSVWPSPLWPGGCAIGTDGEPVSGFGGRGCTLSSAALAAAEKTSGVLTDRVKAFSGNGVNSYFVDVDAVGQLVQDHSTAHPETKADDRDAREKRLAALGAGSLSDDKRFVVGSETAAAWANGVVDFSHGSSTALTGSLWELEREPATWGGYWPEERPAFFFKAVDLPADTAKAMFDPRYLVPLYETVLHDSVVSTDRWELSAFKFPGLTDTRILGSLLRNEPAMISLDGKVLDEHGTQIAALSAVFAKLQKAAGTKALTSFEYLTDDHLVQQTEFGRSLTVTANFGTTASHGVKPGCLVAKPAGGAPIDYCPGA
jgi:hypothetical protein